VPEKTPIFYFFFIKKFAAPSKSAAQGGRLVRLMVKPPLTPIKPQISKSINFF
jgi:hypothetical protein